jgi:hypothetical protein
VLPGNRLIPESMSQDPHAQFDQTVLDKIELSPVGALPHTPAYQDALNRLRASHQVYASADHKGGHVTVRSLTAAPVFYAHSLEAFLAGKLDAAELETDASIFNRYVASVPAPLQAKAEAARSLVVARRLHHRAKVGVEGVRDPIHSLILIPGCGPHPGLAGNYLYGAVQELTAGGHAGHWEINLHDAEDALARCELSSRAEALEKLQEVLASAPFLMSELATLGFQFN